MRVDIDSLTESELIDLNNRIVARLRFLQQARTHASMLHYRIGERVTFHPPGQRPQTGVITRYNKKTVTIVTDEGQHWNVAPELLQRAASRDGTASAAPGNVISLPRPGESAR